MNQRTQFVGIDLHKVDAVVSVLPAGASLCEGVVRLPNEEAPLRRFFQRLSKRGPIEACYEASGCGYVLQRRMASWGYQCAVIAPSKAPRRPGDHIKTDRRDAERLAFDLRAGLLTPVHIPTEADERARGLLRSRDHLRQDVHGTKQYVLKFLNRKELKREGKNWTVGFHAWLRSLRFEGADRYVFASQLGLLEMKLATLADTDREIEVLAQTECYRDAVARLRCFRGIETLTAMTLLTELIDIRRFRGARSLVDYVGLGVSEYSSGSRVRRGGITKAGNSHVRRILTECAWHYRHRPAVGATLAKRQAGQDPAVIAHAWRAQRRLNRKYRTLIERKPAQVAVTAVARELVGFIWAVLQNDSCYLQARRRGK
jgi:transposase